MRTVAFGQPQNGVFRKLWVRPNSEHGELLTVFCTTKILMVQRKAGGLAIQDVESLISKPEADDCGCSCGRTGVRMCLVVARICCELEHIGR